MKLTWDNLKIFDFTDAEAKTLLALLELGPSRVSKINKRADIPRTTTYSALLRLKDRGFVRQLSKGHLTTWKVSRIAKLKESVKSSWEAFEGHPQPPTPPSEIVGSVDADKIGISVYQGMEQIKRAYETTLNLNKSERVYAIQGNKAAAVALKAVDEPYFLDFHKRIKKSGIIVESIGGEAVLDILAGFGETILKSHLDRLLICSLLPDKYMDFGLEVIVFRETVVFVNNSEELVVLVRNKAIVDMFNHLCLFMRDAGRVVNLNKHIWKIIEEKEKTV